jgi:predicted small secreted protein
MMKKTGVLGLLTLTMGLLLAACGESHEAMVL